MDSTTKTPHMIVVRRSLVWHRALHTDSAVHQYTGEKALRHNNYRPDSPLATSLSIFATSATCSSMLSSGFLPLHPTERMLASNKPSENNKRNFVITDLRLILHRHLQHTVTGRCTPTWAIECSNECFCHLVFACHRCHRATTGSPSPDWFYILSQVPNGVLLHEWMNPKLTEATVCMTRKRVIASSLHRLLALFRNATQPDWLCIIGCSEANGVG